MQNSRKSSMAYFGWGIFNGIVLGIILKEGLDISETGLLTIILNSFIPIFKDSNLSTNWLTSMIIFLTLIGILSIAIEILIVYKKGWPARIIAICGFLSFLFLILGFDILGVILMTVGIITIFIFPNE